METPGVPVPARRTLFLGLDGVMHQRGAKVGSLLSCMPTLERALDTAEVDIVVLSCWDFAHDFDRVKAAFPASLRPRVVGRTTEERGSLHKRYKEIQTWLRAMPSADWRVLDSDPSDYPGACTELIRCSPHQGIGSTQAQALRQWILEPDVVEIETQEPRSRGPLD